MKNQKLWVTATLSLIITTILCAFIPFGDTREDFNKSLTEKGRKLIEKELLAPMRKQLKIKANTEMFSRCPSGLRYYVKEYPTETSPYFVGNLKNYRGCSAHKVCDFRLSVHEDKMEIRDNDSQDYTASTAWFSKTKKQSQENASEARN
jgi:hypothetical protein